MLNELLIVTNTLISICYFIIGSLLLLPFVKGQQKTSLVFATILVFFSCAFGHGGHAFLMLNSEPMLNSSILLKMQVGFDLATVVIAIAYIVLHRSYAFLIEGPLLLTQTQDQLALANVELMKVKTQLESLVEERTAELSRINAQLKTEEEALRQERKFIRILVESISDGVVACDAEGRLTLFNRTAREWHGANPMTVPPEEWSSYYDLYGADGITPLRTEDIPLLRAFHGEPIRQVRMAIVAKGQPPRFVVATGDSMFDSAGQKVGAVIIMHDITERKRAEEALQKQTSILQLILDRMSDAVIMADEQGRFLVFNPAAQRMFGSGATKTDSSEWSQQYGLFLPDQETPYPEEQLPLVRAIRGETVNNIEMFVRHAQAPEGNWVIINGRSLKDTKGELKGGLIVCRDITERKQAEADLHQSEAQLRRKAQELEQTVQELQRTQAKLVQSEKMSSLGQLVAGVAHEINNPVNFIHGNILHVQEYSADLLSLVELYQHYYPIPVLEIDAKAEEIDLEFLREDLPKVLSSMQMGTERIRQIVLSLRNFSRMDEAEIKPVDIHEGIDSTLLILQHRLKATAERAAIEVIKDYGELPLVECYAGQLNQVFMNILTNAIDALDESFGSDQPALSSSQSSMAIQRDDDQLLARPLAVKPTIHIHTSVTSGQWVQIAIADNGPGIPESIQQRIFDPFFTTKPVGKGTGMGMSISHQIVTEKHGGQLECAAHPDKGTTFIIQIPLYQ